MAYFLDLFTPETIGVTFSGQLKQVSLAFVKGRGAWQRSESEKGTSFCAT